MGGFAWVTLATNDSYSLGALVLAHSLRRVGTQHDLAVLITPGVTQPMREKLASVFNLVREVNVLDSKDAANLAVLQRPELGITFTKLHCWRLTQYDKCVFVDADALVVRNCDELFEREELSAAPDVGWPDCFNSGVFVFRPSQQTFASITEFAANQGSFDGADQGLLNTYFSDWAHKDISKHLPFIYNMCSTATYSYAPAFKQYGENVRIVHFIGATKPWLQYFDTLTGIVQPPPGCNHLQPLLQIWWNIFCDNVHPQLTDVMAASNMRTNWHDSNSNSIHPNIYNYNTHFHNPDQHIYSEISSNPPDFSEFKDPWETYSERTEQDVHTPPEQSFSRHFTQQTDVDKQYLCDITTNYTEPPQLISHNQCAAEPSPSRSLSSNNQSNEYHLYHSPLQSDQTFQASQQDSFLFQNKDKQEFMDYHSILQNFTEQQSLTGDTDLQWASDNLKQISALCDFIERVHHQPENHSHHIDHSTDIYNQNDQTNYNEPNTSMDSHLRDSRENSNEKSYQDQKQTHSHIPSPANTPAPCTVPNNVATQSELSASSCVENTDGGLAGALSRLTIGEARSDEQRAIEDHMRKQHWEQGQIDFLGRDSFDNILKKINETLSSAPPRRASLVKETRQPKKSNSKDSEVEAAVEDCEVALPVLETEDLPKSNATQISPGDTCQSISSLEVAERPISYKIPTEPSAVAVTTKDDYTNQEEILTLSQDIVKPTEISVPIAHPADTLQITEQLQRTAVTPETQNIDTKPAETVSCESTTETKVPQETKLSIQTENVEQQVSGSSAETLFDTTTALVTLALLESKSTETSEFAQQEAAQVVSEATTEYPVPIQVVESVLQAEPKESVSEDPRPVVEAVVSSIIPPVQESAAAVLETLVEPGQVQSIEQNSHSQQLNGNDPYLQLEAERSLGSLISRNLNIVPEVSKAPLIAQQEVQSPVQEILQPSSEETQTAQQIVQQTLQETQSCPQESQLPTQEIEQVTKLEYSSNSSKTEDTVIQKSKLTVKLPETGVSEEITTAKQTLEEESNAEISFGTTDTSTTSDECPVRPNRSKDLKIPGTPTVIGPTPPTSPPLEVDVPQTSQEISKPTQNGTEEQTSKTDSSAKTQAEALSETKVEDQPEEQSGSQEPVEKDEKEIVKKSSVESDSPSSPESEGTTKKIVKKVVKKVVKKRTEGEDTEESGNSSKPKKVTKKVTKIPSMSLETDETVPETPPPSASSEVPIPPKRKAKSSSSAKVIDKKLDES